MRLFVGKNYPGLVQSLKAHAPELEFSFLRDAYVLTDSPDCHMRIMGMLPRAEDTFLVGEWAAGQFAPELREYLNLRLMRSGSRIENCQRIPQWTTST